MSRMFLTAAISAAVVSLAGAASASCGGGTYCHANNGAHSTLPSLSSYSGGSYASHSGSSGFSTTMSPIEANASYGSGSISQTYSDSASYQSFSGATTSVAGLGYNESLQPTSCPVNVHGASSGSTVLGCYNVVQPVARTSYYRVVRPVIYVRYPVPVAVPYTSPCLTQVQYSRYGNLGGHGHRAHHVGHGHGYGALGHPHRVHHAGGCR